MSALVDAQGMVNALRKEQQIQFGFDGLCVDLVGTNDGGVIVSGEVVVPRLALRLHERLSVLGPRVRVSVRCAPGVGWRALAEPLTRLYRGAPGSASCDVLSTEYLPDDGPVNILIENQAARLVRGSDGTVGWTSQKLGDAAPEPAATTGRAPGPSDVALLQSFAGVPYMLGGTTRDGIDCSGLSQRAYRRLGVVLPRHTLDQLAVGEQVEETELAAFDLLFTWSEGEGPAHVMVVSDADSGEVVHASVSRKRVVCEPWHKARQRCERYLRVPFASLTGLARE